MYSASRTSARHTALWTRTRPMERWSSFCKCFCACLMETAEVEMFKLENGTYQQWATLPLRLVIGYGFMAHGWAKLSRGPEGFAKLLEQIGAPLPVATAWVSTFVELLGGLAILTGSLVAVASVPLIVMMLVAIFTVHLRYGFSAINTIAVTADGPQFGPPGIEVNLLYI